MVSDIFKVYSNLKRKYVSAFLLIFVFTILAQAIIQVFLFNQESKSHVINLAGRQRMLSQRIAKSALLLYFSSEDADKIKELLSKDLHDIETAHKNLKMGNAKEGVEAPFTASIKADYIELDQYVADIVKTAQCFLDDCVQQDLNIKELTALSRDFLYKMNLLVYKSDREIKKSLQTLSHIEYFVFLIIALIMLFEFFVVLLPFQKKLLNHLNQQLKEEAEKEKIYHMAEVGEITSEVIHEINNFMTVVNIATGIIKKKANSETDKANETLADNLILINKIEKNVTNIVGLSVGMLKMTRADDVSSFVVSDVLEEVKEMLQDKLKTQRIEFSISGETNIEVTNLKIKLTQILYNLVKNSIHAVQESENKKVSISVTQKNNMLLFEVSDTGSGIPDELADKIMNPFFTTKSEGSGTGLGLSLSQKLANNLGGELKLTSRGKPTIFELSIKIKTK